MNLNWHRGNAFGIIMHVGFGPNVNIVRDPRFGRASELMSEDPLVSGLFAVEYLNGCQEEDSEGHPKMLLYMKHYTAYSRETDRGYDTYAISMQDYRETYLAQYELAFTQGGATGAMCSYNGENGAPSCANNLKHILRLLVVRVPSDPFILGH